MFVIRERLYAHPLYYFTIVGIYGCVGCIDAPLKIVSTTSLAITHATCHLQAIQQTLACVRFSKLVQLQILPLLNILTIPEWLKC